MSNMVAVDNTLHREIAIDTGKIEQHGADLNLIPTVMSEFTNLACHYPIVLTKNEQTGQFVPVSMLGFESGENLFWDTNTASWQGLYVPLHVQRQPFFLGSLGDSAEGDKDSSKSIVCINLASPSVIANYQHQGNENVQQLFNEEGQETEFFNQSQQCLAELLYGEQETEAFIQQLLCLDLLQVLSLEITFVDGSSHKIKGLYTIDKNKLTTLSDESILSLHKAGYLDAINTMVVSLGQIYRLIDLKNKRLNK